MNHPKSLLQTKRQLIKKAMDGIHGLNHKPTGSPTNRNANHQMEHLHELEHTEYNSQRMHECSGNHLLTINLRFEGKNS